MDQLTGPPHPGSGEDLDQAAATATAIAVSDAANLRMEFGSHLEASYQRLVAQLCMITLDTAQAHRLVQDAYARAWQRWSTVRALPDPTGWIRQLAVRASARRWRRLSPWLGGSRAGAAGESWATDPGHVTVLASLGRLTPHRRRALVLSDVAHLPIVEVARLENVAPAVAEARVLRAREELTEALAARPVTDPSVAVAWEDM